MVNTTFNMYKIKFDNLDRKKALAGYKKVRIFINLEIVINRLLNSRINNFLIANGNASDIKRMFVSNIINIAQHYRLYCAKHNVTNEIYMYWNYPIDKMLNNTKYNPKYKASYILRLQGNTDNWMVIKYLDDIYKSLRTILDYINEVYLLTSSTVESSLIPYIISKDKGNDYKNIIVSTNDYDFQYVNKDFDIWVPSGANSTILNKGDVLYYMKDKKEQNVPITISPTFIPFILSIIGNKSRNIDKIPGIGFNGALRLIQKGLDKFTITNSTVNVDLLANCVNDKYRDLFINNYRTIQLTYQYQDISGSDERDIFNQITDKFDDNALIYLNDKYFKDHPIMTIDTKSDQIYRNEINHLKW